MKYETVEQQQYLTEEQIQYHKEKLTENLMTGYFGRAGIHKDKIVELTKLYYELEIMGFSL